jgi:hypothetical protein
VDVVEASRQATKFHGTGEVGELESIEADKPLVEEIVDGGQIILGQKEELIEVGEDGNKHGICDDDSVGEGVVVFDWEVASGSEGEFF